MKTLTRYVLRQLVIGTMIVTVALSGIMWLGQSLKMIDMVVNRGLSVLNFMWLNLLMVPWFLTLTLPIALFAVVLFTYNKLISDREVVVMRSAGLSQWGLARPALIMALVLVGVQLLLNLVIAPDAYKSFRVLQWGIRYSYAHVALREGTFNTIVDGVTVYVRERSSEGELRGLMIHDGRDPDRSATILAGRGALVESEDGARVILFDGNRQEVDRNTDQFSILYFDRYTFDLGGARDAGMIRYRDPQERGVGELLSADQDETLPDRDLGKFYVEAHRRIVSPLEPLTFTAIALACLITGPTQRRGQTLRLLMAVGVLVAVQAVTTGLLNLGARTPAIIPLMYVNAFVWLFGALIMCFRPPSRLRLPIPWRRPAAADETA